MRNCQVRLNMNYEIYSEESSPVRVLSNVIDEIYQKEEYTIVSKWNGAIPEDIMMISLFLMRQCSFIRSIIL
ncbi:MAG: hypothetical protein IK999_14085 [Ruminococcus sp.]|nr:hypothetical protein [Ruminococcus sp.]